MIAACLAVAPGGALAQGSEELPEELLMGPDADRPLREEDGRIWWVGWQAFLSHDQLPGSQPVGYDWGLGFSLPVMMDLYKGLGTRLRLGLTYSGDAPMNPADVAITYTLPATGAGTQPEEVAKTLPGFFGSLQLDTGLSYTHGLLEGTVNPYAGFGPSLMMVMVFPDLEGTDEVLLQNPNADDSGVDSIDPYSVNIVAGVNAFAGVNFALARTVHLSVEASYTQAKVPETRLEKAKEGYDARRAEFTYGALNVGTGLMWHF